MNDLNVVKCKLLFKFILKPLEEIRTFKYNSLMLMWSKSVRSLSIIRSNSSNEENSKEFKPIMISVNLPMDSLLPFFRKLKKSNNHQLSQSQRTFPTHILIQDGRNSNPVYAIIVTNCHCRIWNHGNRKHCGLHYRSQLICRISYLKKIRNVQCSEKCECDKYQPHQSKITLTQVNHFKIYQVAVNGFTVR